MRLPILMYHAVDRMPRGARSPRNYVLPEQFEAQLATLRRLGYETISFGEWLTYRRGGGDPPPPPPPLPLLDGPPAPRPDARPAPPPLVLWAPGLLLSGLFRRQTAAA